MSDVSSPQVRITWPPNDTNASFAGFDVNIVSFDPAGLDTIEVTLTIPTFGNVADDQRQPYVTATKTPGFEVFSNAHLTPTNRNWNRVLARAKDKAGNYGYYDVRVTFPEPPKPPGIDWSKLVGVDYLVGVLSRKENGPAITPDRMGQAYEMAQIQKLADKRINFLRVWVDWEAMVPYATNRQNVLDELKYIAIECRKHNMLFYVVSGQFAGSSSWIYRNADGGIVRGDGFPAYVTAGYPVNTTGGDVYQVQACKDFFNALYNRSLLGGTIVDEYFTQFFKPIYETLENFDSFIGCEILNEPPILINGSIQWAALGEFHTRVAQLIRTVSVKPIMFSEAIPRAGAGGATIPNLVLTKPRISNVVYAPHTYAFQPSTFAAHCNTFKQTAIAMGGIPVIVGEYAPGTSAAFRNDGSNQNGTVMNQTNTDAQLQALKANGFASNFWAWVPSWEIVANHDLVKNDGTLSTIGVYYFNARQKAYGY